MKKIVYIAVVTLMPVMVYAQCTFKVKDKNARHDQYDQTSQSNIDKSKKQMAETQDEFDKKKYQADLKNSKPTPKRKSVPRYL
jgi:hypothetical protein